VQRFRNTMRMQARDVMGILLLLLVATGTFSLSLYLSVSFSFGHTTLKFLCSLVFCIWLRSFEFCAEEK
jgi:hypothetical protein